MIAAILVNGYGTWIVRNWLVTSFPWFVVVIEIPFIWYYDDLCDETFFLKENQIKSLEKLQRVCKHARSSRTLPKICDETCLVRSAMLDLIYGLVTWSSCVQTTVYIQSGLNLLLLRFYGKGISNLLLHRKYRIMSFQRLWFTLSLTN